MNIYIAVIHGTYANADIQTRMILVADDAAEAEHIAAANYQPNNPDMRSKLLEDNLVEIGRLGTYDPGFEGVRLAPTAIKAIQRPPV